MLYDFILWLSVSLTCADRKSSRSKKAGQEKESLLEQAFSYHYSFPRNTRTSAKLRRYFMCGTGRIRDSWSKGRLIYWEASFIKENWERRSFYFLWKILILTIPPTCKTFLVCSDILTWRTWPIWWGRSGFEPATCQSSVQHLSH